MVESDLDINKIKEEIKRDIESLNELKGHKNTSIDVKDCITKFEKIVSEILDVTEDGLGDINDQKAIREQLEKVVKELEEINKRLSKEKSKNLAKQVGLGAAGGVDLVIKAVAKVVKLVNFLIKQIMKGLSAALGVAEKKIEKSKETIDNKEQRAQEKGKEDKQQFKKSALGVANGAVKLTKGTLGGISGINEIINKLAIGLDNKTDEVGQIIGNKFKEIGESNKQIVEAKEKIGRWEKLIKEKVSDQKKGKGK